ncbi:MAG: CARDB domain-containing protein [Candidatus Paceibacterota bacterium]
MNTFHLTPANRTVVHVLAVVGFVALIGASMWLAAYSTRYVPAVVGRIGSAAVYLGSLFTPAEPSLSVISTPVASTTISFGDASSTLATTADPVTSKPVKSVVPTAGEKTNGTYQISGTASAQPAVLSGFADLVVNIDTIGYLATSSADSFVANTTVPNGNRPAVRFTIKNIGTNVTGSWRFSASIPTQTAYIYQSQPQQSLAPGDSISYTLGFDQANRGSEQTISVTANFDHTVTESNVNNNSTSAKITILGS